MNSASHNSSGSWMSWIRIFDIPDVSKHKDGYTIYKVISLLYPEACPDAVTKVSVWKRFNDFKKLHKEIKGLQKILNIQDDIPNLPKSVLFKRFDEETINERKRGILQFLEFIGKHSLLFTSTVFVKFFETSHTPVELLSGNISSIRAELNLPEDTDLGVNSDDDRTISDSDSFTSSNLSSVAHAIDSMSDSITKTLTNLKKPNSMTSIDSHSSKASESCSTSIAESNILLDGQFLSTGESVEYILNASTHLNMAIDLEHEMKYEEAFTAYKTAIDILINGGKDEPDFDRKQMVRYKTEKYLIRAEKIYNMYLAPEVKNLQLQAEDEDKPHVVKGPLFNLYKYKVIKIISSFGMLVMHSEQQQVYYIKVIHKTVQFLNNHLILPENVPYMVKLVSHYNCENALFLVLEYCSGSKLIEYYKHKSINLANNKPDDQLLVQIQEQSDNESEQSFSELLNDYVSSREKKNTMKPLDLDVESDDSFEKLDVADESSKNHLGTNILDQPLDKLQVRSLFDLSLNGTSQSSLKTSTDKELSESSIEGILNEWECKNTLPEEQVIKWSSQLLLALEKLHFLGVICRDLKMDNLLIDENENLVLTYMCNAKELCDLYAQGVNLNLAPEVYSFEEVTEAVDWWSFGAILYELLVGMPLCKVHCGAITSYTHLKIPKYVSPEGRSLLKQLLIYEPQERLGSGINGTQHLKSHPFFRTISWHSL